LRIDNGAFRFLGTRRELAENEEVRRQYYVFKNLLGR
jgi:hypothetical protein